jgi:hypothetical protein
MSENTLSSVQSVIPHSFQNLAADFRDAERIWHEKLVIGEDNSHENSCLHQAGAGYCRGKD